jgi:hypothetical protein
MGRKSHEVVAMSDVEFRDTENGEPCHKYYRDGKEIPGLSYILESNGFCRYGKVNKAVMEAARERGDAAHFATRLYDEDNPVTLVDIAEWEAKALNDPLDPFTRSRLVGWVKFRKDFEYRPLIIEKPMCWELNGMAYAFTPDRYGTCSMGNAVVEIKATAEIEPSHQIQTAAQSLAFRVEGVQLGRYVVQLLDSDYKIHKFEDRQDERIFSSALAVTWWRWNRGIKG